MLRFDRSAKIDSSFLRPSFALDSAIACHPVPPVGYSIAFRSPSPNRRITLLSRRTGVIHVVTVITAKGEFKMIAILTEETGTAQATATGAQPKPNKKARVAPRSAHVAPKKGKPAKKASPAKKAPKGGKKAGAKKAGVREGS